MKFKKGEHKAKEYSVRYCEKCGCPLPSEHKQKYCDSCNREDANKWRNIFSIVFGLLAMIGLKIGLPRIIKK